MSSCLTDGTLKYLQIDFLELKLAESEEEIGRLREKNRELNRRAQLAESNDAYRFGRQIGYQHATRDARKENELAMAKYKAASRATHRRRIEAIQELIRNAFGETPVGCDGVLIVSVESYNALVDALNQQIGVDVNGQSTINHEE